jgi:hypothetical protein
MYMKKIDGKMNDPSCYNGKAKQIDSSILFKYPHGDDFELDGQNQCNVIQPIDLTPYNKSNVKMYAKGEKYVKQYKNSIPDITQESQKTDIQMKKKTKEYQNVLASIKSLAPSTTLAQQETDLEIVDKQNKMTAILWGLIAILILAIIMFRPK